MAIVDSKYIVEIYSLDPVLGTFTRLDAITSFKNLSFFNKRNGIGSCRFELASQDKKASQANLIRYKNQVVVKRYGVIVFVGPITRISETYQNVTGNITVEANSYLVHFKDRYTAKLVNFVQVEQTTLAGTLVTTTQSQTNGDLAVDIGTAPVSVKRDRTYEYASIAEALMNLSNVLNGFDFTFDPTVDSNGDLTGIVFNTYYPTMGARRSDLQPLRIGENVKSFTKRTDNGLYNSGIAEGAGTGSPIISTLDYGASAQSYTRREIIRSEKDVSVASTLTLNLQTFLNKSSVENYLVDVQMYQGREPSFGAYDLGDILILDIHIPNGSGYGDLTGEALVEEIAVDVDSQGAETITPKLSIIG